MHGAAARETAARRWWSARRSRWPCSRRRPGWRPILSRDRATAIDIGVAQLTKAVAGGATGGDRGQAPVRVATMFLQVQHRHRIDPGALLGVKIAAAGKVFGQRPRPVTRPGLESSEKLNVVDEAVLEGEHPEQEVVGGGHRAPRGR